MCQCPQNYDQMLQTLAKSAAKFFWKFFAMSRMKRLNPSAPPGYESTTFKNRILSLFLKQSQLSTEKSNQPRRLSWQSDSVLPINHMIGRLRAGSVTSMAR
eukprot:TRINITY_DN8576_c0_g2_i1.p1 TRINITY_DN8576_c0_g2~~TRINITY_DN8576_c0_g2_i1.p1  ORF type:complete len:101 (-),score=7.79 TRINITY_DN8576_c0_g2_i1:4-306(-)